jgi:phage shock protein E
MIKFIKNMLGIGPATDFQKLVQNGAVVVDVRTKSEFQSGHVAGALNIPLDVLSGQLSRIPKGKTVITCCASGMRSASAKNILTSNGFTDVFNGGGWYGLQNKLNRK